MLYNENKIQIIGVFTMILFFIISFLASTLGAICGIGGGIIIKPALDLFGLAPVGTISFLSGCAVLSMSTYSVIRGKIENPQGGNLRTTTPLALGAAVGGILGQRLFSLIEALFIEPNTVGGVQACCVFIVTLLTLLYNLNKKRIKTKNIKNIFSCVAVGLALGCLSAFLGIGGGPVNLVVLYYFFSMETKSAAKSSLYIIFVSQLASLTTAIVTGTVPMFEWTSLALMIVGGIGGGMLGRAIDKRLRVFVVDRLFTATTIIVLITCIYNAMNYFEVTSIINI